ncbi:MAG: squalene/phytoene synthase family protein [Nitrospirae bacterium]|nr:squalene/phytoene synthase family protein [Candidatus Manganitrophaceae bacterium]
MTSVESAYDYCRRLTHRCGPHFSVGFRFLPLPKRNAIYAVYAFCRYADDLVDEKQAAPLEELLKAWQEELDRCYDQRPTHPITIALADALKRYPIPKKGFEGLIEGCRMDLLYNRYPTFDSLLVYCDLVATTIRDLSLPVFGYRDPRGVEYGRALSTALQLTNILRDIGEDLGRGRIYLPLEEIEAAGYSEGELTARVKNEAFLRLMTFQIGRVRGYFNESEKLIPCIEEDARLAVSLMRNVYVAMIDRIDRDPLVVLDRQIRLSWWARSRVIAETLAGKFQR